MSGSTVRPAMTVAAASVLLWAGAARHQPPDARLPQLLRERVDVRRQIVDRYEKLKTRGGASAVEPLIATRELLWAELDALTAKPDRVAMLERIVEHEKKIKAFFERTPDLSEVERLLLRVRLLDAEITLERER